eukprot:Hpha_TRINITY_DN1683_c0_g1::TRINITY_DN1683_c0_g1_i1::g.48759::m.48759/K16750/BLOC1S2; biogenesis of lysosome-related organelles complex 1 subunit 2
MMAGGGAAAAAVEDPGLEERDAKVRHCFGLVEEAIRGEADLYEEDLKLLGAVGTVLGRRYSGMAGRVDNIRTTLSEMLEDHGHMQRGLAQIDALEITLQKLESMVDQLDAYSLRLEQRLLRSPSPQPGEAPN